MWGKKPRIYYHGIPKTCNNCYNIGHLKVQCTSAPRTWWQYIESLKESGAIPESYFGSWLTNSAQTDQPISQSPIPGAASGIDTSAQNQLLQQLTNQVAHLQQQIVTPTPTRGGPYPSRPRGRGRVFQHSTRGRGRAPIDLTYTPSRGRGFYQGGQQRNQHRGRPYGRGCGDTQRGNFNQFNHFNQHYN